MLMKVLQVWIAAYLGTQCARDGGSVLLQRLSLGSCDSLAMGLKVKGRVWATAESRFTQTNGDQLGVGGLL